MKLKRHNAVAALGAVALASLLATGLVACGGDDDDGETAAGKIENTETPEIDPADFTTQIDNPFLPFPRGAKWVYEGETDEGLERTVVEVTNETKTVMGVPMVVVRDTVTLDGEVIEDTFDWYAQDREGNVWYFGEDTKEYEDGKVVSTHGAWEAGVKGAEPGIVMKAAPKVGDAYRQEYFKGEAEDEAEVLSLDEKASVRFGDFNGLLQTKDFTPLEPDVVEHKYYAKGVGMVLEVHVKGGDERLELIEFTKP